MKILAAEMAGPPDTLKLMERDVPQPDPGEALLRVAYTTLNPLDIFIRQGRVPWMAGKFPFTPGMEFSGIVEKIGAGVDPKWVGRAVVSGSEFGGCAEYAAIPVKRLEPLVQELGWKLGAAWRTPTLAAWFALTHAGRVHPGETVLIHSAAGPVGIMATQAAKDLGAKVIGLAGGPAKIDFARPYGADILFDYRQPAWVDQVMSYTAGRGVDLILDGNGGGAAVNNYKVIAPNGRVVYLGATSGMAPPDVAVQVTIAKSFSVGGFNLNSIPESTIVASERKLIDRLVSGSWRFPIGDIVPLEEVPRLHARFEARELKGRSLIRIGGDLR